MTCWIATRAGISSPSNPGEGALYLDHVKRRNHRRSTNRQPARASARRPDRCRSRPAQRRPGLLAGCRAPRLVRKPVSPRTRHHGGILARSRSRIFLYGICRFRESLPSTPDDIVAVGWKFKGTALRSPPPRPAAFSKHASATKVSTTLRLCRRICPSRMRALCSSSVIPTAPRPEPVSKRDARNVFRRQHGYPASCPELADLLAHRGPDLFSGPLPWSSIGWGRRFRLPTKLFSPLGALSTII